LLSIATGGYSPRHKERHGVSGCVEARHFGCFDALFNSQLQLLIYDPAPLVLTLGFHVFDGDPSNFFELVGHDGEIGFETNFSFNQNSPSLLLRTFQLIFACCSAQPSAFELERALPDLSSWAGEQIQSALGQNVRRGFVFWNCST